MKGNQNHNITELVELQSKKIQVDFQPKAKSMLCTDHDLEMNFFCERRVTSLCVTTVLPLDILNRCTTL